MDQIRNNLYISIMEKTYETVKAGMEANPVNYMENKRIYLCAFLACLRRKIEGKEDGITVEEKAEETDDPSMEPIMDVIISFSPEKQFRLKKKELLRHLSQKEYNILFGIEQKEQEKPAPEPIVVTPPEAVKEYEESAEEVIEERKDINLENISSVETVVQDESPVDYSDINIEEKKEDPDIPEVIPAAPEIHEAPPSPVNIIDYYTKEYANDKNNEKRADTFCYDKYLIKTENGNLHIYVYPLYYGKTEPVSTNIFVAVKSDSGAYRGFISSAKGNKNIQAIIDDYKFLIRGRWVNGKFSSTLQLLKSAEINIEKREIRPADPTSTTHMIIDKDGDRLHIYPTDFRNDKKSGTAGAVIYSENTEDIFLPTPLADIPYSKQHDGTIITYWIGNEISSLIWRDSQ